MKRLLYIVAIISMLLGCSKNDGLDKSLRLRNDILQSSGCTFDARITADDGERQYIFSLRCKSDSAGSVIFEVLEPDTISGITGIIKDNKGNLTFDDQILAFPLLADGMLAPVSAPWVFLHSLRGGYINACGKTSEGSQIIIHDSYQNVSVEVDVYCNTENTPYFAEILWEGRRILTLEIGDFLIL